ncbi:MAG: dihydrodipicolinate synthase family protein [Rhodospirillales bacterium]|jgi:dihydrodipicolinate synthase/N-acetylneuraminate lyase|tara:strand:- start:791 stop:1687 length:897 start_codon:yes stop_codon:yes gene_type:complete
MSVTWSGVFPALMTEFNKDGSLDLDGTQRHIKSCMDAGIEGLVMLGTLGENASLRAEEKETVLKAAVEATGGKIPVLSGVAEYTTELGLEHAARAKRAGCEGLMVLPSMVYQQDQREGQAHFNAIANGANLPVMIYNNPVSYKLDMTPESFVEMSVNNNIVAVKESSNDSRRMTDMINACGDRYAMFCGVDDLVLENLMFGATGWVSGLVNSFPKEAVALYTYAKAGNMEEAVALYRWFMPLLHLDVDVKLVQYIKLANQMTSEGSEWVRRPRMELIGDERKKVEAIVQKALDTRPNI